VPPLPRGSKLLLSVAAWTQKRAYRARVPEAQKRGYDCGTEISAKRIFTSPQALAAPCVYLPGLPLALRSQPVGKRRRLSRQTAGSKRSQQHGSAHGVVLGSPTVGPSDFKDPLLEAYGAALISLFGSAPHDSSPAVSRFRLSVQLIDRGSHSHLKPISS
jgi:hypothetical protein